MKNKLDILILILVTSLHFHLYTYLSSGPIKTTVRFFRFGRRRGRISHIVTSFTSAERAPTTWIVKCFRKRMSSIALDPVFLVLLSYNGTPMRKEKG